MTDSTTTHRTEGRISERLAGPPSMVGLFAAGAVLLSARTLTLAIRTVQDVWDQDWRCGAGLLHGQRLRIGSALVVAGLLGVLASMFRLALDRHPGSARRLAWGAIVLSCVGAVLIVISTSSFTNFCRAQL